MRNPASSAVITFLVLAGTMVVPPRDALAQSENFALPIPDIEARLRSGHFSILDWRGSRKPDDRTQRVTLEFEDSMLLVAKWASAPRGGGTFNNQPRYETAAYEIQKLFLDPEEYVVPPTIIRAFPLSFVAAQVPEQRPTFSQAPGSAVVALQYWLRNVQPTEFWQPDRVGSDTVYARRIANFNILTYLIGHLDSNTGNFLVSTYTEDPHVFSVDNGVSFRSEPSNRGDDWKDIRVDRLPLRVIDRLETVTTADLEAALGVLVEFQVQNGELVQVEPGENFSRHSGVRTKDDRVQFGLTSREIRDVDQRIRKLVRDAKGRRYRLF